MIILNVPKDKHEQVKKLGVTYKAKLNNTYARPYDIKGCWCLDDDKDVSPVLQWISPEKITFDDLCKELSQKRDEISKVYSFTADVSKMFNGPNNAFSMLTLCDSAKPNVDLKAKLVENKDCGDFTGKKVKIVGTVYWYANFKKYQVNVLHLEVIGEATKLAITNPKKVDFSEIFDTVGQKLDIQANGYILTADVHDVYVSKDGTSYIYTLYADHNLKQTLRCKVTPDLLNGADYEDLVDKKVTVVGQIFLYKPLLTFQLNAISVTVDGPCDRINDLKKWAEQSKDLFHEEKYRTLKGIERIGLIANTRSRGYLDFKTKLNRLNANDIVIKDIVMNLSGMVKAIKELDQEDLDAICIIRDGSDPETLLDFSKPDFLKAIAASKTPIITGVGHCNDELLCNKVAFYRAPTPTDAADYIDKQIYNDIRASYLMHYDQHKNSSQNETTDWKKKCMEAEARIAALESDNLELTRQVEQLKRNKNGKGGLLARIFNW